MNNIHKKNISLWLIIIKSVRKYYSLKLSVGELYYQKLSVRELYYQKIYDVIFFKKNYQIMNDICSKLSTT